MPGKDVQQQVPASDQPCRRCRTNPVALVVRTEPLCRDCFMKYVHTKVVKRMETFRVRNSSPDHMRRLLLPVSFGVSSVALLHNLDSFLKYQTSKSGRTGFSLVVVFVDSSAVDPSCPNEQLLSGLKDRYSDHVYLSIRLDQVFANELPIVEISRLIPNFAESEELRNLTPNEKLTALIRSLPSATARADVITSLRTRLLVQTAKSQECEGILWGDSTTKLAEKTLAETAKGRGFSLPWQVADGESPFGITFNYPFRDILKKEIASFATFTDPPLTPLIHQDPSNRMQLSASSKSTTIDDLMRQYFQSVEENFPSIVSNVVRIMGKLEAPSVTNALPCCKLCQMPVADARFGIHGWGGDQEDGLLTSADSGQGLCYGCTRSMPPAGLSSIGSK